MRRRCGELFYELFLKGSWSRLNPSQVWPDRRCGDVPVSSCLAREDPTRSLVPPPRREVRALGDCEPEVRTCCRYAPECLRTVRTEVRTCCAQFAQLLRIPGASHRFQDGDDLSNAQRLRRFPSPRCYPISAGRSEVPMSLPKDDFRPKAAGQYWLSLNDCCLPMLSRHLDAVVAFIGR